MEKITYRGLKKVMNPKEMKNVLGGSMDECTLWPETYNMTCQGSCLYSDEYGTLFYGRCGFDDYYYNKCICIPVV